MPAAYATRMRPMRVAHTACRSRVATRLYMGGAAYARCAYGAPYAAIPAGYAAIITYE